MKFKIFWIICFLPFIISAEDNNTAFQFVENIYSKYENNEDVSVLKGSETNGIFSPDLLKLIKLDETEAKGEAGYLDWDPLCDCQDIGDPGDFKINNINISDKAGKTIADVSFKISETNIKVSLYLVKIKGEWYIDEIKSKNMISLSKYLSDNLIADKSATEKH